jgi:hypothetical protein
MEATLSIRPHSVVRNQVVWEYRDRHDISRTPKVVSIYIMEETSTRTGVETYSIYVDHNGPLLQVEGFLSAQLKALELLEDNT